MPVSDLQIWKIEMIKDFTKILFAYHTKIVKVLKMNSLTFLWLRSGYKDQNKNVQDTSLGCEEIPILHMWSDLLVPREVTKEADHVMH